MRAPARHTLAASTRALGPIIERVSKSQTAIRLLAGRGAAMRPECRVASPPAGTQCPAPGTLRLRSWARTEAASVGAAVGLLDVHWHSSRASTPNFWMFRGGRIRRGCPLPRPGLIGASITRVADQRDACHIPPALAIQRYVSDTSEREGDYADPHTSEESPRIMARRRGRRA